MRRLSISLILFCTVLLAVPVSAGTGKVIKVLPYFLDTKGRHTKSPSLFDRDAYQAWLRHHPEECSGLRYDVQWKAQTTTTNALKLRIELRGVAKGNLPRQRTLEEDVKPGGGSHWSGLSLTGDGYKAFGEVTAWRVTLWEGDTLLGEQKSFLW
jgi:hypothetical protein